MRQEKYDEIAKMAEWVNTNRVEIAMDGMSIIVAVADTEKIKRLALTGDGSHVMMMLAMLEHECFNPKNRTFVNDVN